MYRRILDGNVEFPDDVSAVAADVVREVCQDAGCHLGVFHECHGYPQLLSMTVIVCSSFSLSQR
eukprot:m.449759 g.449759  ORF g.449759 m.449759 type:complete len:64 (+) comp56903_c0_seq1:263-454(+)